MTVGVIGAGAFGTALAISLAENGPVDLFARSPGHAADMGAARQNRARLPDARFPDALTPTADLGRATANQTLLLAVPMQTLRAVLTENTALFTDKTLVACCKGIELTSGAGPVAILQAEVPSARAAILTGPSFARDIAAGLPTALTLACEDRDAGARLQAELATSTLRLYRTTDTAGAEIGGALKNVMAIACGAVMGAGLGDSARAALMTRGYAEMQRLALSRGARAETLAGLSGFGDLALTCTSDQSRNYRLGLSLGRGGGFDPTITVEGAATARAMDALAHETGLDMPITRCVVALLDGTMTITEAMAHLLSRPLKEE